MFYFIFKISELFNILKWLHRQTLIIKTNITHTGKMFSIFNIFHDMYDCQSSWPFMDIAIVQAPNWCMDGMRSIPVHELLGFFPFNPLFTKTSLKMSLT